MIGVVVVMVSAACTQPTTSENEDAGIERSATERVDDVLATVSYTHLTLPTNREV